MSLQKRRKSATVSSLLKKPSPVNILTRSNEPPSVAETIALRSKLNDLGAELQDVDDEISWAKALLRSLKIKRAQIIEDQDECNAVLSPLRRMPTELIVEILLLVSASSPPSDISSQLMTLTLVCRHWRVAVLSTPALRAKCSIDLAARAHHPPTSLHWDKLIEGASTWCGGAGAVPVELFLFLNGGHNEVLFKVLDPLIEGTGCKRLSLNLRFALYRFWGLLQLDRWKIRHGLEVISLNEVGDSNAMQHVVCRDEPHLYRFSSLLQLEMRVNGCVVPETFHFPWNQLTNICLISRNTNIETLKLLRQCTKLEACTLLVATPREASEVVFAQPTLTLPHLSRLSLRDYHSPVDKYMQVFLGRFRLPSLVHLEIEGGTHQKYRTPLGMIEVLVEFLHQCGPNLSRLSLKDVCPFDAPAAVKLFDSLPTLSRVVMDQDNNSVTLDTEWRKGNPL